MRKQKNIDPDADRDPLYIAADLLQEPAGVPFAASLDRECGTTVTGRQAGAQKARDALQKRKPRPDSSQGLASYFLEKCPAVSWTGGLEYSNFISVTSTFSWLKNNGITPEVCRAMIDTYFLQLGTRVPTRPYCWDFKGKAQRLLVTVQDSGATNRPEDYQTWDTNPSEAEAQSFSDSWENV